MIFTSHDCFTGEKVSTPPHSVTPEVLFLPAFFITEITETFSIVFLPNGPENRSVYMKRRKELKRVII